MLVLRAPNGIEHMKRRFLESLTAQQAERIIESLRLGVPPSGYAEHFTVGRKSELNELRALLVGAAPGSGRLLEADYGSGKSHLLRVIREMALASGYAVSFVTMDAYNGVRGNRMDQIFAAACEEIELPGSRSKGLATLFQLAVEEEVDVDRVLRSGYWIRPDAANYERKAQQFQSGHFFKYRSDRPRFYLQCRNALTDIDALAKACALRGLVLLVDEFEDVVTNLVRSDYRAVAIDNLIALFDGERFGGLAFFAVTPDFTHPWRWGWLSATRSLSSLPTFALAPPRMRDITRLARIIRQTHMKAYGLDESETLSDDELDEIVAAVQVRSSEDRIRQSVEGIVGALDAVVD